MVLTYVCLAALILIVAAIAIISTRSSSTSPVSPASNAAGVVETPASSHVGESSTDVKPSAIPSPDQATGDRDRRLKQPARETRRSGRPSNAGAQQKKPSKVGKVFGKIKRALKKPF